jgi:hypothetical protein
MDGIRYPQSVVGILGKGASFTIRTAHKCVAHNCDAREIEVEVVSGPTGVHPRETVTRGTGTVEIELAARNRVDAGSLKIRVTDTSSGEIEEIVLPLKIWGPRMSFICLVQSSNCHTGWDPRPMAQYYGRSEDELVTYEGDSGGNHAWVHARKLERIFHKWNTPITWLIDDTVAKEQAGQITQWHAEYGDAVSFLPRSYFYGNKRNYNLTNTPEEVVEILRPQLEGVESAFSDAGWPVYMRTMGADQWVGSPGTTLVDAAKEMGFDAQWGIGYDHDTCDTSMYHKGTPWDVYKPRDGNFRVPDNDGRFWLFQWTTRDLLNTSYFAPRIGSTTFSTDADDIKYNGIPRFQMDYYARLLAEYRANISHHDVNVFLVHQEDHDSHIHESNRVLEAFVDQVHDTETFATMDEITAWLNCRYQPEEHPYQLIEMNDPLTCHAEMKKASMAGDIPSRFAENAEWAKGGNANPRHVAYYGADMLWIIEEGENAPKIFYDYTKSDTYEFTEDGEYPTEQVPTISQVSLRTERSAGLLRLYVSFVSSDMAESVPVAMWQPELRGMGEGRSVCTDTSGTETTLWRTKNALILHVLNVVAGQNNCTIDMIVQQ